MNTVLDKLYAIEIDGSVKRCLALLNNDDLELAARTLASRCNRHDVEASHIFGVDVKCFVDLAGLYLQLALKLNSTQILLLSKDMY